MARYEKGQSGNPAGRKPGQGNKVTVDTRQLIGEFLDKKLNNIDLVFDKLKPKQQADFIIRLLPYRVPRLASLTIEGDMTMERFFSMPEADRANYIEKMKKTTENQNNEPV